MYRKVVACPNLVGRVPDTRLLAQFLCTTEIDMGMDCKGVAHNNSKYSKINPVKLVWLKLVGVVPLSRFDSIDNCESKTPTPPKMGIDPESRLFPMLLLHTSVIAYNLSNDTYDLTPLLLSRHKWVIGTSLRRESSCPIDPKESCLKNKLVGHKDHTLRCVMIDTREAVVLSGQRSPKPWQTRQRSCNTETVYTWPELQQQACRLCGCFDT